MCVVWRPYEDEFPETRSKEIAKVHRAKWLNWDLGSLGSEGRCITSLTARHLSCIYWGSLSTWTSQPASLKHTHAPPCTLFWGSLSLEAVLLSLIFIQHILTGDWLNREHWIPLTYALCLHLGKWGPAWVVPGWAPLKARRVRVSESKFPNLVYSNYLCIQRVPENVWFLFKAATKESLTDGRYF